MGKIEDGQRVHQPQHHHVQPKPKVEEPKPEPPKPRVVPQNANTQRADVQNYGNHQKANLNNTLDNRRDNSLLIGGTAGSTGGQFAQRESIVRGSGNITIKNTELSYDYNNGQFVKNQNPNSADFVGKVKADLNQLAPGTRVSVRPQNWLGGKIWDFFNGKQPADVAAVVKPARLSDRVQGHDVGYRLIDQLKNNPHEIAIHKYPTSDNAFAAPRSVDSQGTITRPGKGSAVDISYNPDAKNIKLQVRDSNGRLTATPTDPAIIFGHEANHASHMQRGTHFATWGDGNKPNIFRVDGKQFREANNPGIGLKEEFRTVGMDNHSYGTEPTENRLRTELGVKEQRVSYQNQASHQPLNAFEAFAGRTSNRLQNFRDLTIDTAKGSRNSALIGAGFGTISAIAQGKDVKGVATDAALGAGTGVTQEFIERAVNGPRAATSGMTAGSFRAAATQVKGAAVAGAVINTAFAVHDQWDNLQNDATRSKAIGTIAGEAAVGAASGASGAYAGALAGAAIGSIVPGVGTVIGGVVGFAVGAGVGYLTDKGLRGLGVDKAIATGVTAVADVAGQAYNGAKEAVSNFADGAKSFVSGGIGKLASIFG